MTTTRDERVYFACDSRPEVSRPLQRAVACADDFERARGCLYGTRAVDPGQLEVYVALCKFCFYRGRFDAAGQIAPDASLRAAADGGFSSKRRQLDKYTPDWSSTDAPVRLYPCSLKVPGSMRLREGDNAGARKMLAAPLRLDPEDQVGGSVIMALARAL